MIGAREAHARFPSMSSEAAYLYANDPRNVEAANTLRNVDVGVHNPSVNEARTKDKIVQALKDHVWTKQACCRAMSTYESLQKTALPKKLSEEAKAQWHIECLNEAEGQGGISYSKIMDAFVKAEVTGKWKPRTINNHKQVRLVSLARTAFCYEYVLFHTFQDASIKHRPKDKVISDIAKSMSNAFKKSPDAKWLENDMTAFEFGISEQLKASEVEILRHIHTMVNGSEANDDLFERTMNDRTKECTWTMRYKDETGERRTLKLRLPNVIRESGDRMTSSGNWIQNFIAWLSFLVHPDHVVEAIKSLISTRGQRCFYISARDGRKYMAMFVFEGDDTLGRMEEPVWLPCRPGASVSLIEDFFLRWGWKAKLSWKSNVGYDYARVVGYDILLSDGKAAYDGPTLVAMPEMKRLLTTKQWSTTNCTPQERKTCNRIFAAGLAQGFTHCEPMWAFLKGVYTANRGGQVVSDELVREQYIMLNGDLPEFGSCTLTDLEFPDFEGGSDLWKELARVSAGDFDDLEWATACAEPDASVHGADLALHFPRSWVGRG